MPRQNQFFILDANKRVRRAADIAEWSRWLETADRKVDETIMGEGVFISTAFLGMAWAYQDGYPLLFATVVTGGYLSGHSNHYVTWDRAVAGHHEVVGMVLLAQASAP